MNGDFLARCDAIAPLLGDAADVPTIDVPGVAPDLATKIAADVASTGHGAAGIAAMLKPKLLAYAVSVLRMGDFLGHQGMIDGAAKAIADHLEGMSRIEMARALHVHPEDEDFTWSQQREIRNDLVWIERSRPHL